MLRIIFAFVLFLSPSLSVAQSHDGQALSPARLSANINPEEKEFGKNFLPLTSSFGFSDYVYGGKTDNGMLIYQYLRPQDEIESWPVMASLSLIPVGRTMAKGNEALPEYIDFFRTQVPDINEQVNREAAFGDVYFTHYDAGTGPLKENNLSAVWQVLPGIIGNFQIQKRGGPHSETAVNAFKAYIDNMVEQSKVEGTQAE